MINLRIMSKLLLALFIGLTVSCCSFMPFTPPLSPDDFTSEIARMEAVAKEDPDLSKRTQAHRRLAVLYSHYKNPAPNYLKALKELEAYISLDPEQGKKDDIQNFLSLLKRIETLTKENQKAKDDYRKTRDENQKLKETIENLKRLDVQHEKRKR